MVRITAVHVREANVSGAQEKKAASLRTLVSLASAAAEDPLLEVYIVCFQREVLLVTLLSC